ncbi:MAG: hypothetical protein K1X67_04255 [Fimbriimonadaceae bacterium]|nr:hypothetical protein [Fimbriimonadaceae bacterium]
MKGILRLASSALAFVVASAAMAGTLTVTSPNNGDFLGKTNTLRFNIRNSVVQVTVRATVTRDANPSEKITVEKRFTPDGDGKITGDIALNFNEGTPEGNYTIKVEAIEPNNAYNTETRNVVVDTKVPEFFEFNPITNSFVKGVVPIRVRLNEPNLKEWRVQIGSQDIPNNSGNQPNFTVFWDSANVQRDGQQTINIKVDDEANNSVTKSITVTLDRIAPVIQVLGPTATPVNPGTDIPVAININDQFERSILQPGVTVVAKTMDGQFIANVARKGTRTSGNTLQWTGRIKWQNNLPGKFKIVVTAVDRAGNRGASQEVVVTIRGRGR